MIHKTSIETILVWKRNDKMMVSTQAYAFLSVLFISNWIKCVYFSYRKDMSRYKCTFQLFMGTPVHRGDCTSADCDSVGLVGLSSIFLTSSFLTSDATVSDSLTTTVNSRDIIRKVKIHI